MDVEWIVAKVENVREHYMECRRSNKGKPMRVAYEHIRLVPNNELAKAIVQSTLEDDIAETDTSELKTMEEMILDDHHDIYEEILGNDSDMEDVKDLKPIGASSSLLSSKPTGQPEKDIGTALEPTTKSINNSWIPHINTRLMKYISSTAQSS